MSTRALCVYVSVLDVCICGQHLVEPVPYLMCASWALFSLEHRVITAMRPLHNGLFRLFKRYTVDPCAVGVAKDSVVAELHKCVLRWHDKRALCFARVCGRMCGRSCIVLCNHHPPPLFGRHGFGRSAHTSSLFLHSLRSLLSCVLPAGHHSLGFPAQRSSKKAYHFLCCVM